MGLNGLMTDPDETPRDDEQQQKFGFLFRVWGPDDDPGEARHREYVKEGATEDEAKEKAVEEAKSNIHGIIGRQDSWKIIEVEQYE